MNSKRKNIGNFLRSIPEATPENPFKVLVSGCLAGINCGYNNTSYGFYPHIREVLDRPNVKSVSFCPENVALGTPRKLCDLYGGDGFDVLDGKASVVTEDGEDLTAVIVNSAEKMLEVAIRNDVDLALLMDVSASCGTSIIYRGGESAISPTYSKGVGVGTALLIRNGFKVIGHNDLRSLETVKNFLDPSHQINETLQDHHETEWYQEYFMAENTK